MQEALHASSVRYNHSQIIPSAAKTKTDKIKTLKHRKRLKAEGMLMDESIDEEEIDMDLEELEMQSFEMSDD